MLDGDYEIRQLEVFLEMVKKGNFKVHECSDSRHDL